MFANENSPFCNNQIMNRYVSGAVILYAAKIIMMPHNPSTKLMGSCHSANFAIKYTPRRIDIDVFNEKY